MIHYDLHHIGMADLLLHDDITQKLTTRLLWKIPPLEPTA